MTCNRKKWKYNQARETLPYQLMLMEFKAKNRCPRWLWRCGFKYIWWTAQYLYNYPMNLIHNLHALALCCRGHYVPFYAEMDEALSKSYEQQGFERDFLSREFKHPWQGIYFTKQEACCLPRQGYYDFGVNDAKGSGNEYTNMLSGNTTDPAWHEMQRYNGIDYDAPDEEHEEWEKENPHRYENEYSYHGRQFATRRYVEDCLIRFLHTRLCKLEGSERPYLHDTTKEPGEGVRPFTDLHAKTLESLLEQVSDLQARNEARESGTPERKEA